jgi:hypothetical protein
VPEQYGPSNTLNTLEMPAHVQILVPQAVISATVFSSSPAGLTNGVGGALMASLADSTIADRVACAASSPSSVSITNVSPNSGPAAGGTTVTITGTNFTGTTQVWFGGVLGTNLTVSSDTSITITTPPQPVGSVGVAVITPHGDAYRQGGFSYS